MLFITKSKIIDLTVKINLVNIKLGMISSHPECLCTRS